MVTKRKEVLISKSKVRSRMKEKEIKSLLQLSKEAGLDVKTIHNTVNTPHWRGSTLGALATVLGVDPSELLEVRQT